MKWSLQQLQKIYNSPWVIDEVIDYFDYLEELKANDSDILDVKPVNVHISIYKLDMDTFKFDLHIQASLQIACALTLEPVPYDMDFEVSETYSTDPEDDDDLYPIEGNTIDSKKMVWANILSNVPIRVVRDDAYEILKARNIILGEIPEDEE